jgi:hypothetical protein
VNTREDAPGADASESVLLALDWAGGAGMLLDARGTLHVRHEDGSREAQPVAPELDWPTPVVGVASPEGGSALIGFTLHPLLVHVSSQLGRLRRIALGERLPHAEQLDLFAVAGGFLARLEHGLVFVDESGRDRWYVDRVTFDWRFVAERDGALWLVDEGGNLLGFSSDTGLERT